MPLPKITLPVVMLMSAGLLSGCASHQPNPQAEMARAEVHVQDARKAGAMKHAELALHHAEQKLQQAKAAAKEEQYTQAKRLAEQAAADAQYAGLTAETKELKAAVAEIRRNLQLLEQEMNGKS